MSLVAVRDGSAGLDRSVAGPSSKPCPPSVQLSVEIRRTAAMIVLGADMHKRSHTVAAIAATTGEALGDKTIQVGEAGFIALLDWARGFGDDRAWALEDCRHVSSSFERFLLASGERVVRVPTKLMSEARRAGRDRGKSDRIDALAVARAALREGLDGLPSAQLAGVELDIRLLVDHRERLIRSRVALNNDLLWHLHDLWPDLTLPKSALVSKKWSTRIARRLARAEQTARVRIARDELRRLRELTVAADALEAEIADLVTQAAPQLLDEPRFGPLTAAKAHRRDRRRPALRHRSQARQGPRHRPDPGQLGQDQPPSPRPRRQ